MEIPQAVQFQGREDGQFGAHVTGIHPRGVPPGIYRCRPLDRDLVHGRRCGGRRTDSRRRAGHGAPRTGTTVNGAGFFSPLSKAKAPSVRLRIQPAVIQRDPDSGNRQKKTGSSPARNTGQPGGIFGSCRVSFNPCRNRREGRLQPGEEVPAPHLIVRCPAGIRGDRIPPGYLPSPDSTVPV